MPRNASGIYSLPTGNPVVPSTLITSNWANTTLSDIATAITQSMPIDGSVMTASFVGKTITGGTFNGPTINNGVLTSADFTGGIDIAGNSTLNGNLTQTGNITLTGDLAQTGNHNITGNLGIVGSNRRITGNMSSGTPSFRTIFQTNIANGSTYLTAIPNGAPSAGAVMSGIHLFESSNPDDSAVFEFACLAAENRIRSTHYGTAVTKAISVWTGANEQSLKFVPGGAIEMPGNVRRFQALFHGGTASNRMMFQTNAAGFATSLGILPNGTVAAGNPRSEVRCYNQPDPNDSSIADMGVSDTEVYFRSTRLGTVSTYLPLAIYSAGPSVCAVRYTGTGVDYPGTTRRFTADLSNSNTSQRALWSTNVANAPTSFGVIPNGTSTEAGVYVHNNSNPNNAPFGALVCFSDQITLAASRYGSGSFLPITMQTSGAQRVRIDPDGKFHIVNDDGVYSGYMSMGNNGAHKRATRVVNGNDSLEWINAANTLVTHSFANDGGFTHFGGHQMINRDLSSSFSCYPWAIAPNKFTYFLDGNANAGFILAYFPGVTLTLMPSGDGSCDLGKVDYRWYSVWAQLGTIQTSDAREKTPVRSMTEAELACAIELAESTGVFKWLRDIEKEGVAARECIGQTAQFYIELFAKYGLDAMKYSMVRLDSWDAKEESIGPDGNILQRAAPAGERYSVIYTEIAMFAARGLAEKQRRLEARIAALEAALAP